MRSTEGMVNYVLAAERYAALIEQLGAEVGEKHGWKTTVAKKLGVRPAYISMLVSGARVSVGARAIDRAIERLGLDRSFFYGTRFHGNPHYRDFLKPSAGSHGTDKRRPREETSAQALEEVTSIAKVTPIERQILESIDFHEMSPTPRTYKLIIDALRQSLRPTTQTQDPDPPRNRRQMPPSPAPRRRIAKIP